MFSHALMIVILSIVYYNQCLLSFVTSISIFLLQFLSHLSCGYISFFLKYILLPVFEYIGL